MTTPLWTSDEILAAVGGELHGKPFTATGVTFDSREVEPGDLFVALVGERDGHDFAEAAFAKGAAGALTSKCVPGSHVQVADTLKGLQNLAVAARDRCPAARGAVTGSVGKTSVTQAIKAGLEAAGRAHGSVKSFNNHIGVPLTLARMPRDAERAVFEIGMNHAGEIEPLVKLVRPQAVAVTIVGPVHTENFPDGEQGVARAKAEIFAGLEPGGAAVLNAEDRWFDFLRAEAEARGARVLRFGRASEAEARLIEITGKDGGGSHIRAELFGEPLAFDIAQNGGHWGHNALCTLLMLRELGAPIEAGLRALAGFSPLAGRGRITHVRGATLIDESYNANPISMRAAFATLGARPAEGRRIAVLTDMLELGADAERQHAALAGALDESGIDLVFCAGPLMASLWDALPETRRGAYAETAAALAPVVVEAVRTGDVVMVKGSNGSKASLVAAALAEGEAG